MLLVEQTRQRCGWLFDYVLRPVRSRSKARRTRCWTTRACGTPTWAKRGRANTTSPARSDGAGPPGKLKRYAAAFVGTGIMATLGVFVRNVSPGNEYAITFGRFAGLACLLGWGALRRGPRPAARPRVTWGLAASGVVLPLFVVFYIKAVVSGAMANAAFLLYLGPLIASFLAALWLGEGINRLSAALLGGALLGTLFITEFRHAPGARGGGGASRSACCPGCSTTIPAVQPARPGEGSATPGAAQF